MILAMTDPLDRVISLDRTAEALSQNIPSVYLHLRGSPHGLGER